MKRKKYWWLDYQHRNKMKWPRRYLKTLVYISAIVFFAIQNTDITNINLVSKVDAQDTPIETVQKPQLRHDKPLFLDKNVERSTIDGAQANIIAQNLTPDTALPGSDQGGNIHWKDIDVSYVQANGNPNAPSSGGATWFGNGLVDDGKPTHFIGHTPGDFYFLFDVNLGDIVTITDGNGNKANYKIISKTDTNDKGQDRSGKEVLGALLAIQGESINLQTCYDNNWNVVLHGVKVE